MQPGSGTKAAIATNARLKCREDQGSGASLSSQGPRCTATVSIREPEHQGPATMDNYYKSASPQELRYRDVLDAISALSAEAKELADELDHVVWQVVNRAVDAAVMEHDRQILTNIAGKRSDVVDRADSDRRRIDQANEKAGSLLGR